MSDFFAAEVIRIPGKRAPARRREAMRSGLEIDAKIAATLALRAEKPGIPTIFATG
jgi:LDH2 family malate/lactate/ureidoglycolate dehydrogenase